MIQLSLGIQQNKYNQEAFQLKRKREEEEEMEEEEEEELVDGSMESINTSNNNNINNNELSTEFMEDDSFARVRIFLLSFAFPLLLSLFVRFSLSLARTFFDTKLSFLRPNRI